ncbi:MAG: DNA mismatch repair endonuclease MutL [Candidatus Thermoplasmatota archaeon]|nr:DNA mismatch repair endonuclease MutL [Candidatus Thermoplasmatota archaeon]
MARKIRILDQSTVNKIAAGEVVESPSSVIKELLENSIDAGARDIRVLIEKGGTRRITVIDDGCGMSREDVEVAFTRHSTSKIGTIDDLSHLDTLGFRGEALASIAAVSQVELVSREIGSPEGSGTRVIVSAGRMSVLEPVGCPPGTQITVTDLFENVPARKKFLRSVNAESARCIDLVSRIAMVHPEVGIRFEVDGGERLNSPPAATLRDRTASVLGTKTARAMLEVPGKQCGPVGVSGLVSLPWDTRSNSAGITISIHGRIIRNRQIVESIRRGYGSRLMKGRYPLAVLFLEVSKDDLDVNVHPTKDIVKFENEGALLTCVESAVSEVLFSSARKQIRSGKKEGREGRRVPFIDGPVGASRIRMDKAPVQVPLMEGEFRPQETGADPWREVPVVEGFQRLPPALPEDTGSLKMRIIGQLDRSYILCELGCDLLLVDQHAAHERIRLEELKNRFNSSHQGVQELLEPVHLELDPLSLSRLSTMGEGLAQMGFIIEPFGDDCVVLRGLPRFMGRTEAHEVVRDLLMGNESHEGCSPPDAEFEPGDLPLKDRLIALTACRGAIKAHQPLSLREMEDLLSDLLKCEVPLHCAHGRPTMVRLPLSILEKWFRRVL